ncbi:MAG: LacI family DNA-binding transcriptional regulator [Coraliomargaritaceae bacterium]
MKQVKQQEIAKKLKLSKATVSRCFTNHPGINPQTRALVFETATELGYHHLSNRTNKNEIEQKIFGVLICTTEEEYNRTDYVNSGKNIIKGISEYSQLKNIQLSIHFLDPSTTTISSNNFKDILNNYGKLWDGIIMVHTLPKEIVDYLVLRYPCVSTVEQRSSVNMNCIDVDHYQGINYLINFLHEYGHKRIAFYSIEYKFLQGWVLRRAGAYFEKMTKLGLEIKEKDMINVHPKKMVSIEESFNQAVEAIEDGVTAFVCAADHQAYELIKGLKKRGIRVPEDVSICGFDGVQISDISQQLSTVKIPNYDIGYFATERLFEHSKKRFGSTHHTLLGCSIIKGDTVTVNKK